MSNLLTFVDYLKLVQGGLETWKEKPHNAKWWKRIDGTPIPNDLCVCIAEALREAALAEMPPAPELPRQTPNGQWLESDSGDAEAALADSPAPSTRDAILEEAAMVADQYYRQLSNNGVTFEIYGVASDIRDDIRALKESAAPAPSSEAGALWTPEGLAKRFHQLYEHLAPKFGYETRKESAVDWAQVPAQNRNLMSTVCEHILKELELERTLAEMPPVPQAKG